MRYAVNEKAARKIEIAKGTRKSAMARARHTFIGFAVLAVAYIGMFHNVI